MKTLLGLAAIALVIPTVTAKTTVTVVARPAGRSWLLTGISGA